VLVLVLAFGAEGKEEGGGGYCAVGGGTCEDGMKKASGWDWIWSRVLTTSKGVTGLRIECYLASVFISRIRYPVSFGQ